MNDPAYFRLMADYNRWMNQKIYAVCAELSDEQRKKDTGAFFKSIHGTLNHLLHADRAWMARFTRIPAKLPQKLGEELYSDFSELRRERERTDDEIVDWTATLSPAWLASPLSYRSSVDGKKRILPHWVLAVHMFNHQAHHRGQLTTLLSQLGVDYGITDIPWLPSLGATMGDPEEMVAP